MADKDDQLTPEEKLLKVIQDGDRDATDSPDAASDAIQDVPAIQPAFVPEPTSADIAAAAQQTPSEDGPRSEPPENTKKSRLKLAKKKKKAESAAIAAPPEPAVAPVAAAAAPPVGRKAAGAGVLGISVVNKVLAAVVVLMIGFAVYEIWASIQTFESRPAVPVESVRLDWLEPEPAVDVVPFEEIRRAFNEKSIIGVKTQAQTAQTQRQTQAVTTAVEVYVKQNFNLIGTSDSEAIVVDVKEDKMHFLKVGDQLKISGQTVDVREVTPEHVVLGEGEKEIKVD